MDAHLLLQRDEALEGFEWPALGSVVAASLRSPAKTTSNEDGLLAAAYGEGRALLAVADGVGGLPAGELAAERALTALRDAVAGALRGGHSLREGVLSGFDRANQAVLGSGGGGATTLVVAELDAGHVRTYHVGDSGALVFGGRGAVKLQTIAHSPVGYGLEAGLIEEDEAMGHADRHLVSNVVGDPGMHVGVSSALRLRPRDTLLLASDGLFDNLATREVVEELRRGPLEESARRLIGACRARMVEGGHPDDLTLLAFRPARPRDPAGAR